jgi:two-component system NtrC family response regulator
LSGVVIEVPPLRAREGDVVQLADRIAGRVACDLGRAGLALSDEARSALASHPWPGNVRELENVVREAVLYAEGPTVAAADVRAALALRAGRSAEAAGAAELVECLRRCGGNVTRAAHELISQPTRSYALARSRPRVRHVPSAAGARARRAGRGGRPLACSAGGADVAAAG